MAKLWPLNVKGYDWMWRVLIDNVVKLIFEFCSFLTLAPHENNLFLAEMTIARRGSSRIVGHVPTAPHGHVVE